MTERLDQTTDRVDGQRPHADERRPCPDHEQVGLGTAVPMGDGTQNGRVHTSVTGQFLGIRLVILAITRRDGPQFPGIGYENLVTELRQQLRHPRRMRAGFDRDPSRSEGLETLREAARSTLEAAFLEDLALGIQKAELAPAIPQIDADRERGTVAFGPAAALVETGIMLFIGGLLTIRVWQSRRCVVSENQASHPIYVYAESVIALARLDEQIRQGLLTANTPLGHLWKKNRTETFKE